jgi:hypothetical protein
MPLDDLLETNVLGDQRLGVRSHWAARCYVKD